MKTRLSLAAAMLILVSPSAALAGETVSYHYDAKGRLRRVVKAGSVNNGVTTDYTHDKADNRTRVRVTGR